MITGDEGMPSPQETEPAGFAALLMGRSGADINPLPHGSFSLGLVGASVSRDAGGILPIMQAHALGLAEQGISVKVFGVVDDHTESDREGWLPLQPRTHPAWSRRFCWAPGLRSDLIHSDLDIVHQHGLWLYPSMAVSAWRQRSGRPVVISTQGMLEPWALRNSSTKKKIAAAVFERANLSSAACIHCSAAEVEGIRNLGLKNPIAVLPNGVVTQHNESPSWKSPQWRTEPDSRQIILFLGRLHPKKGISETLQAWAILKTLRPEVASDWRLVIAGWGDGGYQTALEEQAISLGLGLAEVVFAGSLFDEAKAAALAHADAFILASHSEGFPMAVLEAWANSLPVFKTRFCNIPQGFDVGAAIEIKPDPTDIAEALARWLPDPCLVRIGLKGRFLVEREFNWPNITRDLRAVYDWVLVRGPRPDCVLLN